MAGGEIDRFADRWLAQPPVYLTDLDRCEPAAALVDVPALRHWRTLAYTTEDLQGTMLLAGPQTAAPTITYPLEASGWHAISVGLVRCHHGGHHVRASELQVRLTGDRVGTVLVVAGRPGMAGAAVTGGSPGRRADAGAPGGGGAVLEARGAGRATA